MPGARRNRSLGLLRRITNCSVYSYLESPDDKLQGSNLKKQRRAETGRNHYKDSKNVH
jgi:hypothetical protein